MKLPVVAIVGRPNVGKSSLLNALVGRRVSIVQDMPGVTRDRVSIPLFVRPPGKDEKGKYVELVDTGGYGFDDAQGLTEHIKHQIELAMARADLVLFVLDCQAGLTGGDEQIAQLLRRQGIKTVILANKADAAKADASLGDFARLGFGTPVGVSATTGRNLEAIDRIIAENVDLSAAPETIPEPEMLVAIVGKRNAGKSTLVNAVAELFDGEKDRVIVSEVPGTTRDSVDVRFEKDGKALVVIDTAGVRKKRHMVTDDIEFFSFHRAQRSIRRADVVLMLVDATEAVSEPDKKLAQYIAEQYKPVILVLNKWDLARDLRKQQLKESQGLDDAALMEEYRTYFDEELRFVDFAPIAFITAKDAKNVSSLIDLTRHLHKQANERLTTGRLNAAIEAIVQEKPPSSPGGRRPKIYYATQVGVAPPTIVLFVNNPDYIDEQYQRFVTNRFRELLPYAEVPIKLEVRGKGRKEGEAKAAEARGGNSAGPSRPGPRRGGSGGVSKSKGRARKRT
jgi:GTP-binding protein